MDTVTVIALLILGFGVVRGWRNISQGKGIIGRLMPESFFQWVNQPGAGPIAVKAGISIGFSYLFAVFAIFALIGGFLFGMSRMK